MVTRSSVRRNAKLDGHAAEYLRMSREHQRYSLAVQSAAIREFAEARGLSIVRSYVDHGQSGLTLRGRAGLKALLADVLSGQADFRSILVLDVSRWGRFEDPDQAAHYEFLCREAGLQVHYCGEPFDNDGSPVASLLKQMKRVMAHEYSRELGEKIHAAQQRVCRSGFKIGGSAPFGTRRVIVDRHGDRSRILQAGEWKAVQSERVVLVPAPETELIWLRQIFDWYVSDRLAFGEIASRLNAAGVVHPRHVTFSEQSVGYILSNPICLGQYAYNKRTYRLQHSPRRNPREEWIFSHMFPPIVDPKVFASAQRRRAGSRRVYSDATMLSHLRKLTKRHGKLSVAIMNKTKGPNVALYYLRFGSLRRACELAGVEGRMRFHGPPKHAKYDRLHIIAALEQLLVLRGHLTASLIDQDPNLPHSAYVRKMFGTLTAAYQAAGWEVDQGTVRSIASRRRWAGASVDRLARETSH